MTRQEMFNQAVAGLASQGFGKSTVPGKCAYRGDHGRRCAVGWLIDDAAYSHKLEGYGAAANVVLRAVGATDLDDLFLTDLQVCHDHAHSLGEMKECLRDFASNYSLTLPPELSESSNG